MIAPLPDADAPATGPSRGLRRARRLLAETLLPGRSAPDEHGPTIAPWKAWLFAAWIVAVTATYAAAMLGRL